MSKREDHQRIFRLPNTNTSEIVQDAGESIAWVLVSASDFDKVNKYAESLQIQRRPDKAEEIRKIRETTTIEGNENLDLRTVINVRKALKKRHTDALRETDQIKKAKK